MQHGNYHRNLYSVSRAASELSTHECKKIFNDFGARLGVEEIERKHVKLSKERKRV
jgi:hypothetical protein